MSDESYRIIDAAEYDIYKDKEWFYKESFWLTKNGRWAVPEKRLLKELDKKKFYRQKLQVLIDEFDFWKVENIMEVLGWTWAEIGYPKKNDMIKVVESLYAGIESMILKGEYCFCATGGFKLTFNPDEDNELSLVFEAVTNSVYGN